MIVVLDSNVYISALQFGGVARMAMEKATIEDRLAICPEIEEEVTRQLTTRFGWAIGRVKTTFALLVETALKPTITGEIIGVCRDPKDDMVIECAVKAAARLVVTGDKDLLVVGQFHGVRIITPREYINGNSFTTTQ